MLRNSTARIINTRSHLHAATNIRTTRFGFQNNGITNFTFKNSIINQDLTKRFVRLSANDIKAGIFIDLKGKTMQVVDAQHSKKGRGAAHVNLEMREFFTGKKSSTRLRSSDSVEKLYVETEEFEFSHFEDEGDTMVFLNDEEEELRVSSDMVPKDKHVYLQEGELCKLRTIEDDNDELRVLKVHLPDTVELEIVDFGITASNHKYNKAKMDNGMYVMVPPFLETGDRIIVRTSDDSYVERAED